MQKKKIKMN